MQPSLYSQKAGQWLPGERVRGNEIKKEEIGGAGGRR